MKILINGCPKHGNHALQKAVELLGQHPADVSHIEFGNSIPNDITHALFIYRDPRDALLSFMRWDGKDITEGTVMAAIQGPKYLPYARSYTGWMHDSRMFKVRYEELIANDLVLRGIADYLNVAYRDDAFSRLPGLTRTYRPDHSNFKSVWSQDIEACWDQAGGNCLVTAFNCQPY